MKSVTTGAHCNGLPVDVREKVFVQYVLFMLFNPFATRWRHLLSNGRNRVTTWLGEN